MESGTVLLDSSIIIDYFRKENKSNSILFKLSNEYNFSISTITVFEIKIGLKTERHWEDYNVITKNVEILSVDDFCIDEAVKIFTQLKKQNKLVELADLLIAATAISNSLPLVTQNKKHFVNIPKIELFSFPAN